MTDLNDLIQRRDDLHRELGEQLHSAHREALDAAQAKQAELSDAASDDRHREALAEILANAASARHKSRAAKNRAELLVGQHASTAPQRLGAASSAMVDGAWQVKRLNMANWYSEQERQDVTAAVIYAASGGDVELGLLKFPTPWHVSADTAALEDLARLLAPAELESQQAAHAAKQAEHDTVAGLCQRLNAAAPSVYVAAEQIEEV